MRLICWTLSVRIDGSTPFHFRINGLIIAMKYPNARIPPNIIRVITNVPTPPKYRAAATIATKISSSNMVPSFSWCFWIFKSQTFQWQKQDLVFGRIVRIRVLQIGIEGRRGRIEA